MDLRDASHEEAVEAIRKAGNPVAFLVQSIIHRPRVRGLYPHTHMLPLNTHPGSVVTCSRPV